MIDTNEGPAEAAGLFDSEAVRLANATKFGLAAYVQTKDLAVAHRSSAQLEAGIIWINGAPGVIPGAPFGGMKNSGYGRVGGQAGLHEFLRPNNVWLEI